MATLYNADLKPIAAGGTTHPYDHATKLFLADNYRLTPKQSFLYYVVLNVDTTAASVVQSVTQSLTGGDVISSQSSLEQIEAGMLVKRVELPRFSLQTKTLNAYNKKNLVQTQIQYDPVTIAFHDDNADIVTNFWNDYYTYYYRDSDYQYTPDFGSVYYNTPDEYQPRLTEGWGFNPRNGSLKPFLKSIQIFSLHQKRFTEYTLINPLITSWRHGQHSSDAGSELMENTMSVAYETVKYRTGYVNGIDVNGFGVLHYDNTTSPISTSTTNIYTDGGLIGTLAGSARDLARPDGKNDSIGVFGSLLNAYRLFNQDINVKSVASVALGQFGAKAINGAVNSALNSVFFPTASGTPGYGTVYGSSQVYDNLTTVGSSSFANPLNSSAVTIAGAASSIVGGAAKSTLSQVTSSTVDSFTRGVQTPASGPLSGISASTIFQVGKNNGTVATNAKGDPVTGQVSAYTYDSQGNPLSVTSVNTTASGALNLQDLSQNRLEVTYTTDQEGNEIHAYGYKDGSAVLVDPSSGEIKQIYLGNSSESIFVPENTRNKVINGQSISTSEVQYYTDPKTGITYTVGNSTSAQITNKLSGAAGLAAGTWVGAEVTEALNSTALGRTVIGQTISAGLGSAAGIATGTLVNNGLQPLINGFSGAVVQGWDSVSGSIKNIVGTWTGDGGFNSSNPTQNVVTQVFDADTGLFTNTYKDGSVVILDEFNDVVSNSPGSGIGASWWNSIGDKVGSAIDWGTNLIWTDKSGNPITSSINDYINTPNLFESFKIDYNTWGSDSADNYEFADLSDITFDTPTFNYGGDPGLDIFYG